MQSKPVYFYLLPVFFLLHLAGCGPSIPDEIESAEANLPETIDYNFHVKPILSDRCYACHGPDEKALEAGLRLDDMEHATSELPESEGHYAIVPGNLRKSQVFHRVISDDPDVMMPPPESNLSLTAEEKAILVRWIEEGAAYTQHWSFIPPVKSDLKLETGDEWSRNGIDPFVLVRLLQERFGPF